jgi:voltage-gated sodium channel
MTSRIRQLSSAPLFHRFILAVIVLAGLVAGLETNVGIMQQYGGILHAFDDLIIAIFIAEALIKMAAHGRKPWRYFADGWNIFDFTIILLCLMPIGGPFAAVLRLARALRLMRLVSALPNLQLLVGALLKSLSAMWYVGLLLGLLFYIYAVAGIHLFGETDATHFGSLSSALFSLFRLVTLDNWVDIYAAQIPHVPVIKVASYFVTFIVFGTMIILNLFIGIIMNSMSEMHEEIAKKAVAPARRSDSSAAEELQILEQRLNEVTEQVRQLRGRALTADEA